jgi:hypothetical protein
MPSTSEKVIERNLTSRVKKAGGWCIKILSNHISGLPDRLCLFPGGQIVFVELKSGGKKPRPIQVYVHKKIRALGFRCEVIDSLEQVKEFIEEYERIEPT